MDITLIDVACKDGCDEDGVQLAFAALIEANLEELFYKNNHNLSFIEHIKIDKSNTKDKYKDDEKHKYLKNIVKINNDLAKTVYDSLNNNNFVLTIGGDHSIAIGSIAGASKYNNNLAVVYVDAHADMNTGVTTNSNNVHGMSLSASMGLGHSDLINVLFEGVKVAPEDVYLIGARDIEAKEYQIINDLKMEIYEMDKVKELGLQQSIQEIVDKIKASGVKAIHLSFDIDVMDGSLVLGTGYSLADGFNLEQVKLILSEFIKTGLVKSLDFVEYNPLLDDEDQNTKKISLEIIDHILSEI